MTAIALTIAGSDSGGGAGIQADLKTFSALGVYGASVITALTAQNTKGVSAIHDVPADFIAAQIDAVCSDLDIGAVKIGMLSRPETIRAVAESLRRHATGIPVVLDPVMVATSGDRLISQEAVEALSGYPWPGNVRELENTIERLVLFSRASVIDVQDLPPPIRSRAPGLEEGLFADLPSLDELERRYLQHVLKAVDGNRSRAAAVMGVDRRTLYRMAERFGIDLKE